MKTQLTSTLIALTLCSSAFSQAMWGSTGALTVALTISYEQEALQQKTVNDAGNKVIIDIDPETKKPIPVFSNAFTISLPNADLPTKTVDTQEYGSKISTAKWGNADIIRYLVDNDLIPVKGKAPHIAGWSLIVLYDGMEGFPMVYARHTDKTMVEVPDIMLGGGEGFDVAAITDRTVSTTVFNPTTGDEKTTIVRTYSDTFKGIGSASVPTWVGPIMCNGLLTGSYKYVPKTETLDGEKFTIEVLVPGAMKLDKIVGVLDGPEGQELVEGSISVAAGVVVDLNIFFPQEF
jgi:hypothetical protein